MSFISKRLKTCERDTDNYDIVSFLFAEGFKCGTIQDNKEIMHYVAEGNTYTVLFSLYENYLSLCAEHNYGEQIYKTEFYFKENDFYSFLPVYFKAIEWAKAYMDLD